MASRTPKAASRPSRLSFPKWAVAALVLILAVVAALLLAARQDSSEPSGSPSARGDAPSAQKRKDPTSAAESTGTLTAAGTALFSVARGGLEKLDGERVTGRGVSVQTVERNGVWVGTSPSERVFVRTTGGSAASGVAIGDRVDVSGTVRGKPGDAAADLGLDAEGRRQIGQ